MRGKIRPFRIAESPTTARALAAPISTDLEVKREE